jgi:23S rRNA (cytosine1962-C5)-methyltransferase
MAFEKIKSTILDALIDIFYPKAIYERSDFESRKEEGLTTFKGLLYGNLENPVLINENGHQFFVDIVNGLKTGFYLDQRGNRLYISSNAYGLKVLDLFCYTGGFSIYLAKNGCKVLGIDINQDAIDLAKENAQKNNVKANFITNNAFEFLENTKEKFDLIIADPPAIAKRKDESRSILWAIYKIAFHSLKNLNNYGRLFICSCSNQLSIEDMIKQVRLASFDLGLKIILKSITIQPNDHPILPAFPESFYLKCLEFVLIP